MADEILLTQEGYDKIVAEHEELVSVRRKEISEKLKEAISYGDLSENAEYDAAKNEQAEVEERIFKLEDMIKKAISLGVAKINVNTECQLSFADATRKYIEAGKDLQGKGFDPRKLLAPGFEAIKATVKEKMELFGSVNKA